MGFQDLSIKRKVMGVIMLTSVIALVLTAAAFMLYDFFTHRQTIIRHVSTISSIIAEESGGPLAYDDEKAAEQILAPLRTEPHIVGAALYNEAGRLYVRYPADAPLSAFPSHPARIGKHFEDEHLV